MTDQITKIDGAYENVFLNVGGKGDRGSYTRAVYQPVLQKQDLEAMYEGDGFARKIIDLPADEMIRAGYEIEGIEGESDVRAKLEGVNAMPELANAMRWSSLYGGALVVMIINDGGQLSDPMNMDRIKSLDQLRVYDRYQVSRHAKYQDPMSLKYGKTEIYLVSPCEGHPYFVHESRCLVFDGVPVPESIRSRNDGWGASKLQQLKTQLVRYNMAHYWSEQLLERAQQAVHGIPGLTDLLRGKDGEALVRKRVELVDLTRSINNTIVIDAEESYDLKATPLSGVPDLIDRHGLALSAVSGMSEAVLFGRQQAGLNSTGKSETDIWRSKIIQDQNSILLPALDVLVSVQLRVMNKYTEDYLIKFNPLSVPADAEQAETELKRSQARKAYWDMQAVGASDIRSILQNEGMALEDAEVDKDIDKDAQEDVMREYLQGQQQKEDKAEQQTEMELLQAEKLRAEIAALNRLQDV